MRPFAFFAVAGTVWTLSGCAPLPEASQSVGCWVDRTMRSSDPRCARTPAPSPRPPLQAPVANTSGTAADAALTASPPLPPQPTASNGQRWSQLQHVLDEETQQARQAQARAVEAMQSLPATQRARAGAVEVRDTPITDRQSGEVRQVRAIDAISVEMPLAAKGRAPYKQAMDALKTLANEFADNRGAAQIVVHQSPADVKARRVNTASGVTHSHGGKPVTVHKRVDEALPAGVERYTIRAGEIRGQF